ncbi:Protein N-acetyltransferase, RimJ/RimL family [Methanobrevibacter millerae]|uniref:Protein N-acetyltransferase, RimJ/RimL family n=2 Tax=Methanobrevibacter millerae TaxID=230361 RepID=A0A1G5VJZ2_9EURY|nr:Protein N-acetyltransferase, RimJ/RimL family [Methanobrevibacter millerae]
MVKNKVNVMILKSERLILRPWKESDAEALYELAKNPKIGPVAGWPPHKSVEESLNIINTVFSKRETYAIVKDSHPIGCVGLLFGDDANHEWGEGSAELGYWIGEEYWGKGYAFEASQALIKKAFSELNVKRIFASYRIENTQSKRVLEKLGFEYLREMKNTNYLNEEFRETAMILEY